MKEIEGNIWDYYQKPGHIICITTNGFVKQNGEAVMGRGCARQARDRIPGLAKQLGDKIKKDGNHCHWLYAPQDNKLFPSIVSFPVKHHWAQLADINLIARSANELYLHAWAYKESLFILPRPGCGNGGLKWEDVKAAIEDRLPDNVWVITNQ